MLRRYPSHLWLVILVPPAAAAVTIAAAPKPEGIWTGHLAVAVIGIVQIIVLLAMAWLHGFQTLRAALLGALAVTLVGLVIQISGNLDAADAMWGTTATSGRGAAYAAGRDRAALGAAIVFIGGVGFAAITALMRRAPLTVALLGLFLAFIPPPFVWPAVGVMVLLVHGLTSSWGIRPSRQARGRD